MQSLRSLLPSPAALIPLLLALLVIVPAPDLKAAEDGLAGSSLVDPALLQALNESERVGARVYYLEAEGFDEPINQSTLNREVSPVLIELASAFLPGELKPVESMLAWGVGGVVNTDVVRGLVTNPNVLWIELDETAEIESAPEMDSLVSCVATSTRACVQGNRFGIEMVMDSANGTVRASSSQSAVFSRYASSNWEVVAKVLNGCSINNSWWVFAAGATNSGYILYVYDVPNSGSIGYDGGILVPITDTGQFNSFPCP